VLSHGQMNMTDFYLYYYGYTGSTPIGISDIWELNKYNETPFKYKGITSINQGGISYYACRKYGHDFLKISPQNGVLAEFRNGHYFSDQPGTEKDPCLLIQSTYAEKNKKSNTIYLTQYISNNYTWRSPLIRNEKKKRTMNIEIVTKENEILDRSHEQ